MVLFKLIKHEDLRKVLKNDIDDYYLTYKIPKKTGGFRVIDAPQNPLKEIQEMLLHHVYYRHTFTHSAAMGFKPGVRIEEGAKKHLGSKVVLNIDIKNFFPSFDYGKVFRLNKWILHQSAKRSNYKVKDRDIADLTRLVCYRKRLPQGSPASPCITNLIFNKTDLVISRYAVGHNLTYTRYADDITLSSEEYKTDMMPHLEEVEKIINEAGFRLKHKKTRILRPHQRMTVTGINVNDKLGIPKWKARNFRAKIHNLRMSQKPISREKYEKIRGYAEWIKNLNKTKGEKFIEEIGELNLDF